MSGSLKPLLAKTDYKFSIEDRSRSSDIFEKPIELHSDSTEVINKNP